MTKDELKPYLTAFEAMLEKIYLPMNREIKVELKFLEKGTLAVRGKVLYPDYGVTADLLFTRQKKDRDQYDPSGYRLSINKDGKTNVTSKTLECDIRDLFMSVIDTLVKTGDYITVFTEES